MVTPLQQDEREPRHFWFVTARIKQLEELLKTEGDKRKRDEITREFLSLTDPFYTEPDFL